MEEVLNVEEKKLDSNLFRQFFKIMNEKGAITNNELHQLLKVIKQGESLEPMQEIIYEIVRNIEKQKSNFCFKKGDAVRCINPNKHFFDEAAEVLMFDQFTNKYLLEFNNGYKCEMDHHDIAKCLSQKEQRELQRAHLFQLADLTLDISDPEWFNSIVKRLKSFT